MEFWTFVLICALGGMVLEAYRARLKHIENRAKTDEDTTGIIDRLNRIEQRLSNLETIVIERDRHREFDRAL